MSKLDKKGQGAMEYLMTYGWAIMVVMIVGVVLWQMGIFKIGSEGKGQTGFAQVKVLDHAASSTGPATTFTVVFMNVAGVPITGNATVVGSSAAVAPFGGTAGARITAGDKFNVTVTSGANDCPTGEASYDVQINITWTNTVTGIDNTDVGRIWGPC